jgi:hypothetical protein
MAIECPLARHSHYEIYKSLALRIYRNSTVWMSFSYRSLASTGGIPLSALNPKAAKPPPSVAWVPYQQALCGGFTFLHFQWLDPLLMDI